MIAYSKELVEDLDEAVQEYNQALEKMKEAASKVHPHLAGVPVKEIWEEGLEWHLKKYKSRSRTRDLIYRIACGNAPAEVDLHSYLTVTADKLNLPEKESE